MKRDYGHEDFEEFLKRSADNLRMKAPDKVWQGISGELTKNRRRFRIVLSGFFLLTGMLGYLTISTTRSPLQRAETVQPAKQNRIVNNETTTDRNAGYSSPSAVAQTQPELARPGSQTSVAFTGRSNRTRITSTDNGALAGVQTSPADESETVASTANAFTPTVVDEYPEPAETTPAKNRDNVMLSSPRNELPWTIESTVNSYSKKYRPKGSRFQTQFHFAPTISYRKLTENKSYLRTANMQSASPNYAALYSSVNNMVTHKPDMGFELGITEKYSVSKTVRIKAGLQFNVNRYDIKAFQAPFALAAITLNNRRTARVDSLWTISNYSNVNVASNKSSWLQNFSFQASAPVGVEVTLTGNDRVQFGIATSVQPTYVLGDRAYMITSDYKSYSQVPWLLRRWNVNTAFETFVTYQSGKTRWQVGPQVRYQLLSSFISNYPVKENLFDFGLKVGVSVIK